MPGPLTSHETLSWKPGSVPFQLRVPHPGTKWAQSGHSVNIHLFSKCLLRAYYLQASVMGAEDLRPGGCRASFSRPPSLQRSRGWGCEAAGGGRGRERRKKPKREVE